jgi:hypothetical protein
VSKRTIAISINCDAETCYDSKRKKLCSQVLTSHFGTRWVCGIFRDSEGEQVALVDREGWLQRCSSCIGAEI